METGGGGNSDHSGGDGDPSSTSGGGAGGWVDAEYCGSSNPIASKHSLFPRAVAAVANPTLSHEYTYGLGGVV